MEVYHNVRSLEILKSILESGFIKKDNSISNPCVYLTRDSRYLSERGIRIVLDYNKLRHNYKVRPFCYRGWSILNNKKFIPKYDEMEERVYNDIDIIKACIRIDVDINKHKLDFNNNLINETNFRQKRKTK